VEQNGEAGQSERKVLKNLKTSKGWRALILDEVHQHPCWVLKK